MGLLSLAQGFVALGVGYLPTNPNEGLAKWLFASAVVCAAVAIGFFLWPDKTTKAPGSTQSGSQNVQISGETVTFTGTISTGSDQVPTGTLSDGRILVDVTPRYLTSLFDEHTQIQADKLLEAYLDKWMRVTGPIHDVTSSGSIYFKNEGDGPWVFMRFEGAVVNDRLRVLRKSDEVTVVGRIARVSAGTVVLEDCELEQP